MPCDCTPVGDLYPPDAKLGNRCAGMEYFLNSSKDSMFVGMLMPLVLTRCTVSIGLDDSCSACDSSYSMSSTFLRLCLAWLSSVWTVPFRFPVTFWAYLKKSNSGGSSLAAPVDVTLWFFVALICFSWVDQINIQRITQISHLGFE